MLADVLRRNVVLDHLERVRSYLHAVAEARQSHDEVDPATARTLVEHLTEARRRHGDAGSAAPEDLFRFTARDRVTSLLQSAIEERAEAEGDAFTTDDPRWVPDIAVALAKRLLHHGNHAFNPQPAPPVTIGRNARLVVFGDWGTGLPGARAVAQQARAKLLEARAEGRDGHAIHLGDVYYAGEPAECRKRVLADGMWPVARGEAADFGSFTLTGNHDMYSGGYGYFETVLADDRFRHQRTRDGRGTSFFDLVNEDWRIMGLDTAYDDAVLWHGDWGRLHGPQADHVNGMAAEDDGRALLLLSHHQFVTVYDKAGATPALREKLAPALDSGRVSAWIWGHEHRCMTFEPQRNVDYLCCLGHAGMPVTAHAPSDPIPAPGRWEWREQYESDGHRWLVFGFAVLDFDGPAIEVSYLDQHGAVKNAERVRGLTGARGGRA